MTTLAQQYFDKECTHSISKNEYRLIANPEVEVLVDTLTHNTVCTFSDQSAIVIRWDHSELTVLTKWVSGGRIILERVA